MKSLIKTFIICIVFLIVVVYCALNFYGKPLVSNIASRILQTDIKVGNVKFIPLKLNLELTKISIPKWQIVFPRGVIHLIPLKLKFVGLDITQKVKVLEDKLFCEIQVKGLLPGQTTWIFDVNFKNINIVDLSSILPEVWTSRFSNGSLNGKIKGIYKNDICELNGILHFYNMVYDESNLEPSSEPLGIPIENVVEFIQDNDGSIDFDFTYRGPLDELTNPFRYRPGPKIIRSLGSYLIKAAFD